MDIDGAPEDSAFAHPLQITARRNTQISVEHLLKLFPGGITLLAALLGTVFSSYELMDLEEKSWLKTVITVTAGALAASTSLLLARRK